jgi:hypothetical protein
MKNPIVLRLAILTITPTSTKFINKILNQAVSKNDAAHFGHKQLRPLESPCCVAAIVLVAVTLVTTEASIEATKPGNKEIHPHKASSFNPSRDNFLYCKLPSNFSF